MCETKTNRSTHIDLLQRRAMLAKSFALHCDEAAAQSLRSQHWPHQAAERLYIESLRRSLARELNELNELQTTLNRLDARRLGRCEQCTHRIDAQRLTEDPFELHCQACRDTAPCQACHEKGQPAEL